MLFKGLEISLTGMSAQRIRIDVASSNLANANAINPVTGEPYRRKVPVFESVLVKEGNIPLNEVRVKEIAYDESPFKMKYDPNNPLADKDGYVTLPNVDPLKEMVDMVSAMRSYEANLTAFNTHKNMLTSSLEILRA
ncbi:flagellar basal body rod protein FlgC [Desulfurobacterium atlanticum]|uniref:Flagellar basal-body rod protein FlgC n=1 Tax=Desulfurobacterium atlanticum TaxID=240169 RepID=A0A238YZ63_9BACT|nr:flagellar basal body rod protein FlgC [Desulfurobacterium atlanticum]SNR76415.1 flagellar basal-body rod protein FlgC [Desulfurobacterium atlanticum]